MKKEMNNKGFSLVELIIVIAIMVVLIAVLAPQYLKYVEKSRVASDQTTVVEYINAMQVLAADPEVTLNSGDDYTLTSAGGANTISVGADLQTLLVDEGMLDANAAKGADLQSTAYTDANLNIVLKYNSTAKVWNVEKVTGSNVEVSGAISTP
ncbi:MAG: prepilin-type N-terminal cleavage/methylation domain-containing protein [Lachnospiraceae bacterium]|nr:prepilin-type N-terminal cleavage/methylation domain-containing protein [Lachnospiraceae bacterium]